MATDYQGRNDPKRNKLKHRLGPGFWIDQNDNLHISITELLDEEGLPHTPENMAKMRELAREFLKKFNPQAEIVDRITKQD